MAGSRPEARRLFPRGMTRPRAMKVCVALLACSAIVIVVVKRGLLGGLGYVATDGLLGSSYALALLSLAYLLHIWWADRFRLSIGRLMLVVALVAVLFQGSLAYIQWITAGLPKPPGAPAALPK